MIGSLLAYGESESVVGIENLRVRELRIGDASIDLDFQRVGDKVVVVAAKHSAGDLQVLAHL